MLPRTTTTPSTASAAPTHPGPSARRRLGATALTLALVATAAAACGSGSGPAVATGSVSCHGVSGSVRFSPPLTAKGTSPETTTIRVTARGCTASDSSVSTVASASAVATATSSSNACQGLLTSKGLTFTIHWAPSTITPTVVHYSGYAVSASNGKGEFTLPNAGGTATVTGSFAGADHGARSTAQALSSESATGLVTACGSAGGLASIPVTSGSLALR